MTDQQSPRRRFVLPGWRTLGIAAGVAGMGIVALVALRRPAPPASRFAVSVGEDTTPVRASTDPLMAELLRCRSLSAGTDDAACREAWDVNRSRFLGDSARYIPPSANATERR